MENNVFYGGHMTNAEGEIIVDSHIERGITTSDALISCGDEREVAGLSEVYLHVFGSLPPNVAYNVIVLNETLVEGSSTEEVFSDAVGAITPTLIELGYKVAVHSDEGTEGAHTFDTKRADGTVGCAYLEKRQDISKLISENGAELIARAAELFPFVFTEPEDGEYAEEVVRAHGRMADHSDLFGDHSGRKTAIAATDNGAHSVVVLGQHTGRSAVINLEENSALDNVRAAEAGDPTYSEDLWVVLEAFDKLSSLYGYDKKHIKIATIIDVLGTLSALGIDPANITVNRPGDSTL